MQDFVKTSLLLSVYGIFKEFRPSEPYLIPYMTGPPLNLTTEQISQDIYPISTYSTFVLLVIVFLVTDYLRYKVIIIIQAICAITTYLMLIFGRNLFQMQIMQVVYGLYLAGEVAYFTYIYAKVEKDCFQEVTSYTRAAYLVGKSLSGIVSQAAVYYDLTSYKGLLWITVGSEMMALFWAFMLPPVDRSMYFHRDSTKEEDTTVEDIILVNSKKGEINFKRIVYFLWHDFTAAFTNKYVLKWVMWWALATCGYYMVTSYIQVLWKAIRAESHATDVELNGLVETTYTLLGAFASMAMGRMQLDWQSLGEPLLAICSLAITGLLYTMSVAHSIYVTYVTFILFTIIFQTMITVASSEVAKHINRDSYGLIFGITTFILYLIESLFAYIALQAFRLGARAQFEVYAIYFGVLGFFFVVATIANVWKQESPNRHDSLSNC